MRRAILHLKQADPVLREIIERVGPCRIRYADPDFETLVRSIVFQQLSGSSARAIFARLKDAAGAESRIRPEGILTLSSEEVRRVGLSRRKTEYLRDLAEKTQAGIINFQWLPQLSDEAVIEHLSVAKGIGTWTAHMFLIFALRRPDVLATGDLGIRSAMRRAYRLRTLPTPAKAERLGAKWHPHCSLACWYLWHSKDNLAGM
jgi:DNA-3-methyladenine glycosylase II